MMKNNSMVVTIVVAVVVGAGAFFGGMEYQKSQAPSLTGGQAGAGQFQRGTGGGFGSGRGGNLQGSRPVSGDILSSDASSVTVKMQDGSTKIIILSDKTMINKATAGTKDDLKTGTRISAFGTTNSDGSVTAQMITLGGGLFGGRGLGRAPAGSGTPAPSPSQAAK